MNSLLLQQFGGQKPSKVRSSHNVLLVELMSPYDDHYYKQKETFVALFKRIGKGTSLVYRELYRIGTSAILETQFDLDDMLCKVISIGAYRPI